MSIKLNKNRLIVSFSIVLFSLISISIAKADLVVTVFDSSCSPVNGANVIVKYGTTEVCNDNTNLNGVYACSILNSQNCQPPYPSCPCPYSKYTVIVKVGGVEKYSDYVSVGSSCTGSLMIIDKTKCPDGYCQGGKCVPCTWTLVNTFECTPGSRYPYLSSIWTRTCKQNPAIIEEMYGATRFCWL